MKNTKDEVEPEVEALPTMTVTINRLVEAGKVYLKGDVFDTGSVPEERLVFMLSKDWLWPAGGFGDLPEPLLTYVALVRD